MSVVVLDTDVASALLRRRTPEALATPSLRCLSSVLAAGYSPRRARLVTAVGVAAAGLPVGGADRAAGGN